MGTREQATASRESPDVPGEPPLAARCELCRRKPSAVVWSGLSVCRDCEAGPPDIGSTDQTCPECHQVLPAGGVEALTDDTSGRGNRCARCKQPKLSKAQRRAGAQRLRSGGPEPSVARASTGKRLRGSGASHRAASASPNSPGVASFDVEQVVAFGSEIAAQFGAEITAERQDVDSMDTKDETVHQQRPPFPEAQGPIVQQQPAFQQHQQHQQHQQQHQQQQPQQQQPQQLSSPQKFRSSQQPPSSQQLPSFDQPFSSFEQQLQRSPSPSSSFIQQQPTSSFSSFNQPQLFSQQQHQQQQQSEALEQSSRFAQLVLDSGAVGATPEFDFSSAGASDVDPRKVLLEEFIKEGTQAYDRAQFNVAEERYGSALALAAQMGDLNFQGIAHSGLGNCAHARGNYQGALEQHYKALEFAKQSRPQPPSAAAAAANFEFQSPPQQSAEGRVLANIASVNQSLGRYTLARDSYIQSEQLCRESFDVPGQAAAVAGLGIAVYSLGSYQEAIKHYQHALDLFRSIGDVAGEGSVHGNLGNAYQGLSQYAEAEEHQHLYLRLAMAANDVTGQAAALGNLGATYQALGNYQSARIYYQKNLDIAETIGDKGALCRARSGLGSVLHAEGRYTDAVDSLMQALQLAQSIHDRPAEGQALSSLGNSELSLCRYDDAISHLQHALKIATETGDLAAKGRVTGLLGTCYQSVGQQMRAIDLFKESLEIAVSIGDLAGAGRTHGVMGSAYHSLGLYPESREHLEKALEISRSVKDSAGECRALGLIGALFKSMNNLAEAKSYLQQALVVAERIGDTNGVGRMTSVLGSVLLDEGNSVAAAESLDKSIRIALHVGDRAALAKGLYRLALVCRMSNGEAMRPPIPAGLALQEATLLCTDSLEKFRQLREAIDPNNIDMKMSTLQQEVASANLLQLLLVEQSKFPEAVVVADQSRAQVLLQQQQQQFQQQQQHQQHPRTAQAPQQAPQQQRAGGAATAAAATPEMAQAAEASDGPYNLGPTGAEVERLFSVVLTADVTVVMYTIIEEPRPELFIWCLAPSNRRGGAAAAAAAATPGFASESRPSGRFSQVDVTFARQPIPSVVELRTLVVQCRQHIFNKAGEKYDKPAATATATATAGDQQAVQVRGIDLRGGGEESDQAAAAAAAAAAPSQVPAAGPPSLQEGEASLRFLRRVLVPEPIAEVLLQQPGKTVAFCPTGVLHLVPFAALPMEPPRGSLEPRYLIETHPIVVIPSLTTLKNFYSRCRVQLERPPRFHGPPLVAGSPDPMPKGLCPLQFAPQELRDVFGQLSAVDPSAQLLQGRDATFHKIQAAMQNLGAEPGGNLSASVVHLTTHGVVDSAALGEQASDSWQLKGGLACAAVPNDDGVDHDHDNDEPQPMDQDEGGLGVVAMDEASPLSSNHTSHDFLLGRDIARLKLWGTNLAVLSACDTHRGTFDSLHPGHMGIPQEGAAGLSYAFLLAGAARTVVSLWPVADETSQVLMRHFYSKLLESSENALVFAPHTVARALQQAILATRSYIIQTKPNLNVRDNPFFWAGFTVVGLP